MRPPNPSTNGEFASKKPSGSSKSFDSLRLINEGTPRAPTTSSGTDLVDRVAPKFVSTSAVKRGCGSHFSDDLARSLALGPGNFLSRSQDSLSSGNAGRRNLAASFSTGTPHQRPDSALSAKVISSANNKNKSSSGLGSVGVRTMSSAQLGNRRVNTPLIEKSVNDLNSSVPFVAKSSDKKVTTSGNSQSADARITRTKMTVTELQKQKHDLESYVSELVKKAEVKQAELVGMKIEIRRLKEERGEEYEKLAQENEMLKQRAQRCSCQVVDVTTNNKIIDNEVISVDCNAATICKAVVDASTSPVGDYSKAVSSEDTTTGGDSDEALPPSGATTSRTAAGEWDRQSTSSEISLACLQDRIVQMEETHYSTNEELQATLQELTDLQDTVNELTKENQQLVEEKTILYESLCKQSEKLDNYRLQIENLKHLLLSGTDLRFNRCFAAGSPLPKQHRGEGDADNKAYNREQQLLGILKNAHEEHEDLLRKFENLRTAYKCMEEERKLDCHVIDNLKDRLDSLQKQLDKFRTERKYLEINLCECRQQTEKDKREIYRLSNALEKEKNRADELLKHANVSRDKDDTQRSLELIRIEKDRAQDQVSSLEENLSLKSEEIAGLRAIVQRLEQDVDRARNENVKILSINEEKLHDFGRENELLKNQLHELKSALLELDQSCQRHVEDKNEYRNEILTLQKSLDESTMYKEQLRKELTELNSIREREFDEWRQFQADLQVAVVVANDFKVEAQEDIERLTTENSQLREKLSQIGTEVEKLRNSRLTPTKNRVSNSVHQTSGGTTVSPDLRARLSGYLNSIESATTKNNSKQQQQLFDSSKPLTSSAKCVLSVRALVESLENASSHRPGISFGVSHTSLRSPGASGTLVSEKSSDSPVLDSTCSPMSKMSSSSGSSAPHHSLTPRPVSLESIDVPVKPQLRTALSEREALGQQSQVLRGSPQKTNGLLITADETIDYFDNGTNRSNTKSILHSTSQQLPRKMFYSEIENKDPLAKLMKDAPRGSRRNALLRWCQNRTTGCKNVEITNFSSSWNDGLAFCALLYSYAPNKIPFETLDVNDKKRNFTFAFKAAEELGIHVALNVDEMLSLERPNWQSVMSLVTSIYKHFEI